jgi:hypothetical protein
VGSQRGFVSMRLLVVLGLVVAAVWVVPFVALRDASTSPTTAAGATAVGATVGGGPIEATTGAAGATAGATGATSAGDPVSDPIRQANDVQAQALLNDAIRVAQVYYAEHGSFEGFGPEAAGAYDPSILYTDVPASNMVTMSVSTTSVVLVTVVELNGGYLCAAATGDVVTLGRTNALTSTECQGGWG